MDADLDLLHVAVRRTAADLLLTEAVRPCRQSRAGA